MPTASSVLLVLACACPVISAEAGAPPVVPAETVPLPAVVTPAASGEQPAAPAGGTRNRVIAIVADRLARKPAVLTDDSIFVAGLGADSLDIAEIMMDVEDAFHIRLPDGVAFKTIGDLVKIVETERGKPLFGIVAAPAK